MADPILPGADVFLTPAIDQIVELVPGALAFFNSGGRWADLPTLWRAQLLLNLARLGDEVQSARLRFSTGAALRALCASEFNTQLPEAPQTALGTVGLVRTSGTLPQGIIRTADTFRKVADPNALPVPVAAATYNPVQPVYVAEGQSTVIVPLVAATATADANIPNFLGQSSNLIAPGQPFAWDPNWQAVSSSAGGGSSGLTDPVLVAAARAYAIGQFGPTLGAVIAGLLRQQSVRHYAVFPASQAVAYAQAYVTDESWGWDNGWLAQVAQSLVSAFQGFGLRTRLGAVLNQQVAVTATLMLESSDDLNDTSDIDENVRSAAESYMNDRPDWYRFRLGTLRALLGKCDPRIQQCVQIAITDAVTGETIPEPPNTFGLVWQSSLTHYYLTDRNITTTYLPPT